MPRTVTLTFNDGTSHVYNGVPDDATPDAVIARAGQEFSGKQITNIDGGKGTPAEDAAPMPGKETVAPGVPTFDPKTGSARAQGILETITGPGPTATAGDRVSGALGGGAGSQQDWFQKQQQIESVLRAQGKTDDAIAQDPGWQEASRNLSRAVSAGATSTALGEVAGAPVAAGIAKGVGAVAKPVVGVVRDALGKESALAAKEVTGEAKGAVGQLIGDAQRNIGVKQAVDKSVEGRPSANVIQVERPVAPDAAKLTQARLTARDSARQLNEAQTKLQSAQRNMSSLDKYAGQKRSEAMVRAARRDLNKAQSEVNRFSQANEEAGQSLKQIEAEHKEALKAVKAGERQETVSARKIESDGAKAENKVMTLQKLSAELNAAKEPADIARSARKVGDQLFKAKKMTPDQYTEYLRRIETMVDKAKSTADARSKLVTILKASALGAAGAAGLSYEIRRF